MRTSTRGMSNNRGFTLVELSVVLFVLGLVLWVAVPRLSRIGEPDRDTVFRDLSAESEAAYDLSLFGELGTRLLPPPRPADGDPLSRRRGRSGGPDLPHRLRRRRPFPVDLAPQPVRRLREGPRGDGAGRWMTGADSPSSKCSCRSRSFRPRCSLRTR